MYLEGIFKLDSLCLIYLSVKHLMYHRCKL